MSSEYPTREQPAQEQPTTSMPAAGDAPPPPPPAGQTPAPEATGGSGVPRWVKFVGIGCVAVLALFACVGIAGVALLTIRDSDTDADPIVSPTEVVQVVDTPTPSPTPEPEPEPTPTEEPGATTEPTPEPTVEPTPTPDSEPEPTQPPDTTAGSPEARALIPLLLTEADLGAGWTATYTEDEMIVDDEEATDEPFEAPCGIEAPESLDTVAEVSQEFQQTELGPFLTQTLSKFSSSGDAEQAMGLLREWFACDEWTETDDFGDEITFVVEPKDFASIGDDTFALTMSFGLDDSPELNLFGDLGVDLVFVRRGEYISYFIYFDFFGMSGTDLESLIRRADEKVVSGG
jgi:hypothetical protein